jgi:hypothetical protein
VRGCGDGLSSLAVNCLELLVVVGATRRPPAYCGWWSCCVKISSCLIIKEHVGLSTSVGEEIREKKDSQDANYFFHASGWAPCHTVIPLN